MRFLCGFMTLVFVLASWPEAAEACTGVNFHTGKPQSVRQIYKTRVNHPGRYFAEATHDRKSGRPLIIYYRRYATAPGFFKSFVRRHECCHHIIERRGGNAHDEIAANCCALRGLSKATRARVGRYIVSRGVNSNAMFAYAGAGQAFWNRTAARCPGLAGR